MNVKATLAALVALASLAALPGCEGAPDNGPPPVVPTQESVNATIEKIKADPNMNEQAKAAAIAAVQRGLQSSQQAAEQNKNNQRPKSAG